MGAAYGAAARREGAGAVRWLQDKPAELDIAGCGPETPGPVRIHSGVALADETDKRLGLRPLLVCIRCGHTLDAVVRHAHLVEEARHPPDCLEHVAHGDRRKPNCSGGNSLIVVCYLPMAAS